MSVQEQLKVATERANQLKGDKDIFKRIISNIDLTTLNPTDTVEKVVRLTQKVNEMPNLFPALPAVAAICIYPNFVDQVKSALTLNGVKIAAVSGAFPSSQTFIEVKREEAKRAIKSGADELDIVLPLNLFYEESYGAVVDEILEIRDVAESTTLKVIIESGLLKGSDAIERATFLAIEGGADFVKTSTGKVEPAATPESAIVICNSIAKHYSKSGKRVGFKAAGGIVTPEDALLYYSIVETILGEEWLGNSLFRIGASRLANNLITYIENKEINHF